MKNEQTFPYGKILIVGCGGAGKSTLAAAMGKRFALPVVNLDKLWWLPNWKTRSENEFDDMLQAELCKSYWIIEGNFVRTFGRRLGYADLCIFLDYPTELCLQSVYSRAEQYRGRSRPDMTEGCIEQVDHEFEQWIRSYGESVKPNMLRILKDSGTPYKVFNSRKQADDWVSGFRQVDP